MLCASSSNWGGLVPKSKFYQQGNGLKFLYTYGDSLFLNVLLRCLCLATLATCLLTSEENCKERIDPDEKLEMEEPLLETTHNCLQNQGGASVVVDQVETLSLSSSLPVRWEVIVSEVKKVSYIALPMVVTNVSQNLLRVISMMMIGHLGELSLSGASIATSLTNVTGFSLLVDSIFIISYIHMIYLPTFRIFLLPQSHNVCLVDFWA